jgi:hypothetical protein
MSESESSLTTIGSVLEGGLVLFLAMREIILAFFLPLVLAPVFALVFLVIGLATSVYLVTAIGKFVGDSGLGLGNKTLKGTGVGLLSVTMGLSTCGGLNSSKPLRLRKPC